MLVDVVSLVQESKHVLCLMKMLMMTTDSAADGVALFDVVCDG